MGEDSRQPLNVRQGLRRLLIVLAGVYWIGAIGAAVGQYRLAYESTAALADDTGGFQRVGSGGKLPPGYTLDSPSAGPWDKYRTGASDAPPSTDFKLDSPPSGAAAASGAVSHPTTVDYDPFAKSHVSPVNEGLKAAGGSLLGWLAAFVGLSVAAWAVRWVWRGFKAEPPDSA